MAASKHPLAPDHLPPFIPPPDGHDPLLLVTGVFLVVFVFFVGLLYWRLHALPEHIAHRSQKFQYQLVCVLALLAMFTHVHAFWIAGLLLAVIDFPDWSTPLRRIAEATHQLASAGKLRPPTARQ